MDTPGQPQCQRRVTLSTASSTLMCDGVCWSKWLGLRTGRGPLPRKLPVRCTVARRRLTQRGLWAPCGASDRGAAPTARGTHRRQGQGRLAVPRASRAWPTVGARFASDQRTGTPLRRPTRTAAARSSGSTSTGSGTRSLRSRSPKQGPTCSPSPSDWTRQTIHHARPIRDTSPPAGLEQLFGAIDEVVALGAAPVGPASERDAA